MLLDFLDTIRLRRRDRNLGESWKHNILDQRIYGTICIVFGFPVCFGNRICICTLVVQGNPLLDPPANPPRHHRLAHRLPRVGRLMTVKSQVICVDRAYIRIVTSMVSLRLYRRKVVQCRLYHWHVRLYLQLRTENNMVHYVSLETRCNLCSRVFCISHSSSSIQCL